MRTDVLVVGGGPAGIATAIAASLKGLRVTVVDARKPPIDKPCGEGLLPEAVSVLHHLGIRLTPDVAFPFAGFCFLDDRSSAVAPIPSGTAFGVRRTVLHRLLVKRALETGVSLLWGTHVSRFGRVEVHTNAGPLSYRWLIGADGNPSSVRRFAGLEPRRQTRFRFGFRRHYAVAPWTDRVEVHWGDKCQMVVAPTGPREICVSAFTGDSHLRLERAMQQFPEVAERIAGAQPLSSEAGAVTLLSRARAVTHDNIALVGDASCTVDGIAGQGLSLAFRQALHLADVLSHGDLSSYESAHRRIIREPVRMTRLLLALNASAALRRRVLRLFAGKPALFAKMISAHTGASAPGALNAGALLELGWRVMWA